MCSIAQAESFDRRTRRNDGRETQKIRKRKRVLVFLSFRFLPPSFSPNVVNFVLTKSNKGRSQVLLYTHIFMSTIQGESSFPLPLLPSFLFSTNLTDRTEQNLTERTACHRRTRVFNENRTTVPVRDSLESTVERKCSSLHTMEKRMNRKALSHSNTSSDHHHLVSYEGEGFRWRDSFSRQEINFLSIFPLFCGFLSRLSVARIKENAKSKGQKSRWWWWWKSSERKGQKPHRHIWRWKLFSSQTTKESEVIREWSEEREWRLRMLSLLSILQNPSESFRILQYSSVFFSMHSILSQARKWEKSNFKRDPGPSLLKREFLSLTKLSLLLKGHK